MFGIRIQDNGATWAVITTYAKLNGEWLDIYGEDKLLVHGVYPQQIHHWPAAPCIESPFPDALRCPNCGEQPGAASCRGGVWEIDWCESCGLEPDGCAPEPNPNMLAADDYDDPFLPCGHDDPYAHREELRRLHQAQV